MHDCTCQATSIIGWTRHSLNARFSPSDASDSPASAAPTVARIGYRSRLLVGGLNHYTPFREELLVCRRSFILNSLIWFRLSFLFVWPNRCRCQVVDARASDSTWLLVMTGDSTVEQSSTLSEVDAVRQSGISVVVLGLDVGGKCTHDSGVVSAHVVNVMYSNCAIVMLKGTTDRNSVPISTSLRTCFFQKTIFHCRARDRNNQTVSTFIF